MSELEFYFAEQQAIMNMPEESIPDYLARRRRSQLSASYVFHPDAIITDDTSATSFESSSTGNGRTTSIAYASKLPLETPQYAERPQEHSEILQQPVVLSGQVSPAIQLSGAAGHINTLVGSKRRGEPNAGILKRPRRKAGDTNASADLVTQAPPDNDAAGSKRPSIRMRSDMLSAQTIESVPAREHTAFSTSECAPDVLVKMRHPPVFAEQGTEGSTSPIVKAADHTTRSLSVAVTSSENCTTALPADPSTSHQARRKRPQSQPEATGTSRVTEQQIPAPSHFNRRSTVADCSNITTPPSTLPTASVPTTARPKDKSSADDRRVSGIETKGEIAKTARAKKGKTKKELITPLEYAQRLQAHISEQAAKKKKLSDKPFLKGKRIFYYGADLNYAGPQTRNRMDIITRHGGTLVPKYDPAEITHIVTDADERVFLRAIGVKELSDIPQHIPTVKWSWVVSGFDRAPVRRTIEVNGKGTAPEKAIGRESTENIWDDDQYEYPMDYEFQHAAFKERIDAGRTPWGEVAKLKAEKGGPKKHHSTSKVQVSAGRWTGQAEQPGRSAEDISNISDFTQDIQVLPGSATINVPEGLPSPPSSPERQRLHSAHVLETKKPERPLRLSPHTASSRSPRENGDAEAEGKCRSTAAQSWSIDPLAGFYDTARAERDAEMLQDDGPDSESAPPKGVRNRVRRAVVKKGFLGDDKEGVQRFSACPNQDVIDKLQELKSLHAVKPSKDDEWRVLGYNKAIAALRKYPKRITSYEEAVAIRGIGDKTAQKIMEIIGTGELRRIDHERTEDVEVIQTFLGIYGVGLSTAFKWYNNGCRSLEDIAARKGGIKLSTEQEIGLKYYEDINTRIPRAEVEEIYSKIKAIALQIDSKLFIEIMGSFRRGKADCGDIDVLITRPTDDGKTHQGVLRRLLKALHQQGIITEDLCLPDDFEDLELVYRGLCRKDAFSPRRRIDFLTVPWISRGAALLYYTGDDIFNRSLRLKANKMGYSLNQRGLFVGVIRNPSDRRQKLDNGQLLASEGEREILDILGVPWQEPHERVRG